MFGDFIFYYIFVAQMPFDKITLPSVSILECFERVKTLFLND